MIGLQHSIKPSYQIRYNQSQRYEVPTQPKRKNAEYEQSLLFGEVLCFSKKKKQNKKKTVKKVNVSSPRETLRVRGEG